MSDQSFHHSPSTADQSLSGNRSKQHFQQELSGKGGFQTHTHTQPPVQTKELPSHSSNIKSCPVIQDIFVVIKASLVGQCSMCESRQTLTSQRPYNLTGTSEGSQMKTCCQRSQKIHWFWQTLCQDCVLQTIIVPSVCFFVIGASRWNTH